MGNRNALLTTAGIKFDIMFNDMHRFARAHNACSNLYEIVRVYIVRDVSEWISSYKDAKNRILRSLPSCKCTAHQRLCYAGDWGYYEWDER